MSSDLTRFLEGSSLSRHLESSIETLPDPLPFLHTTAVAESARWAGFDEDATAFLLRAADRISADPDARLLAWHCHRVLFTPDLRPPGGIPQWPMPVDLLGDFCGALYLIVALSGLPAIRSRHRTLGVPEQIMWDTYRDTLVWARQYHTIGIFRDGRFTHPTQPGLWGISPRILPWLLCHLDGALYRVGRLQYKIGPFRPRFRAYRSRSDGRIILLAESGLVFRAGGRLDGAGGVEDPAGRWTAELIESSGSVTASPVHPSGHAVRQPVEIPLNEWDLVLRQEDPILEIHIPEDGRMDFDACGESVRGAIEFFETCHPERTFKAVVCGSWFLDPVFQVLLPYDSNIVRFQRECYLYPLGGGSGRSGLERIFGAYSHDLASAPRDTRMRRAVLHHLDRGGVLTGGGAILFRDDLPHWGSQRHLSRF